MNICTKIIITIIVTCSTAYAADVKTLTASRDFCRVEIRAGNTFNPETSTTVFQGAMSSGQQFQNAAVNHFYRREANPGQCESNAMGGWNSCQWDCNIN